MGNWLDAGETFGERDTAGPFHHADLPDEAFPVRIMCLAPDDRTVVFHEVVHDAPAVLEIPSLGPKSVGRCIVLFADGTWEESTD